MKTFYGIYIISFLLLSGCSSDPDWILKPPKGYENDYFVGLAESKTSEAEAIKGARNDARVIILKNRLTRTSVHDSILTNITERKGKINNSQQNITQKQLIVDRVDGTLEKFYVKEDYVKYIGGIYRAWSLVRIPKPISLRENPPTKWDYFVRGFIPGWAQFYKGEPTKGYFITGGTAAFFASGFVFSKFKMTAESDAKNSRTQVLRDYYNDNANTYYNISLACFIVTAAVYVYNIIDAVAAEGEKIFVYKPQQSKYTDVIVKNIFTGSQNIVSISIEF